MKKKNKSQKMTPQVRQKYTFRLLIAGSSVLVLVAAFFVYFNFGNSAVSRAANGKKDFVINYHTTDLKVPGLLLEASSANEKSTFNNYKCTPGARRHFKSDADSVAVIVSSSNTTAK